MTILSMTNNRLIKKLRFTEKNLRIIVKADVDFSTGQPQIKNITVGLPRTHTKLEEHLLKYVKMYAHEAFTDNLYDLIVNSLEYQKLVKKGLVDYENEQAFQKQEQRSFKESERRRLRQAR